MSSRLRYWIYGTLISAAAIGTGLLTDALFDFHWAIVSMLLLGLANIPTLAGRYYTGRLNIPLLPIHPGTGGINAVIEREGRTRYLPKRDPPQDRITWFSQPTLIAAGLILAVSVLG